MAKENYLQELKTKYSSAGKATEWTPMRTAVVAGVSLLVIGFVAVIIIRAKKK